MFPQFGILYQIGVPLSIIMTITLFSMKQIFGSYSIIQIMNDYKKKKEISEIYHKKFELRDTLLYHIAWARSRGDHDEANTMIQQLAQLDKVSNYYDTILFLLPLCNVTYLF